MTDREAIERLLTCRDVCDDCLTCLEHDEALYVAIAALKEREERSKGCKFCEFAEPGTFVWLGYDATYNFCPVCGRPLKGADNESV